jgi:DNA primase large subunit
VIFPSFSGANGNDLQNDIVSHYIIRLAFCSSEEELYWFITQKLEFFRSRFQVLTEVEQLAYLNDGRVTSISSISSSLTKKRNDTK